MQMSFSGSSFQKSSWYWATVGLCLQQELGEPERHECSRGLRSPQDLKWSRELTSPNLRSNALQTVHFSFFGFILCD